jgi:hypothetical protein
MIELDEAISREHVLIWKNKKDMFPMIILVQ